MHGLLRQGSIYSYNYLTIWNQKKKKNHIKSSF